MAELWDLLDVHRDLTGETWERGTKAPIPQGRYHIIVSVWTITPEGNVLITKRHHNKSFGGLWENTGGAVMAGESSVQAALRELREETGLVPDKGTLLFMGDVWHPGYVVDTYLYSSDVKLEDLKLQEDEVVDARWATLDEIDELYNKGMMVPSVYKTFCCYRNDIKDVLGL